MTVKKSIGSRVRCVSIGRECRRETLGDLTGDPGRGQFQRAVQEFRDGYQEQRAGGGHRIIRKRTPE